MDPRLQQLSYSSLETLYQCPRKFQLQRLGSVGENSDTDGMGSLTFCYGSTVGDGMQQLLAGADLDSIIWNSFLAWKVDLAATDTKRKKDFYSAVIALQRFAGMRAQGFLEGYEVLQYNGKPATELGFMITLPGGFKYRGFMDVVLKHRETGDILVADGKTTWFSTINPATYKNSAQALGYSVGLDVVFPGLSSYKVAYLVYQTTTQQWNNFEFTKTYLARAQWIQELLFVVEDITRYEQAGIFPMRGSACFSFGRECQYFQTCTLNTAFLITPLSEEIIANCEKDKEKYEIQLTLDEVIDAQLARG